MDKKVKEIRVIETVESSFVLDRGIDVKELWERLNSNDFGKFKGKSSDKLSKIFDGKWGETRYENQTLLIPEENQGFPTITALNEDEEELWNNVEGEIKYYNYLASTNDSEGKSYSIVFTSRLKGNQLESYAEFLLCTNPSISRNANEIFQLRLEKIDKII